MASFSASLVAGKGCPHFYHPTCSIVLVPFAVRIYQHFRKLASKLIGKLHFQEIRTRLHDQSVSLFFLTKLKRENQQTHGSTNTLSTFTFVFIQLTSNRAKPPLGLLVLRAHLSSGTTRNPDTAPCAWRNSTSVHPRAPHKPC